VSAGAGLPPGAEAAMAEALAAVDAAPDGWLGLPQRRRLRMALGPWTPLGQAGSPDPGLVRRAALAAAAAERALPVWEAAHPGDGRPREVIELARAVVRGEADEDALDAVAEPFADALEALGTDGDDRPYYAASAAVRLRVDALDGDLDPELHPPEREDTELDAPVAEAFAARAVALFDAEKVRAFWRWYVTEAFPAAYRAAS
jgi:Immunity protein Imm5